jgi:hypothetical protein
VSARSGVFPEFKGAPAESTDSQAPAHTQYSTHIRECLPRGAEVGAGAKIIYTATKPADGLGADSAMTQVSDYIISLSI